MASNAGPDLSCFDFDDSGDEESRDQMVERHEQELLQLQADFKARKKAIPKIEIEARREVDSQLADARRHMEERHANELGEDASAARAASEKKKSKSAKRRQKKEEQEKERDQRIADERAGAGPSAREVEVDQLTQQLAPLGLGVEDIPADGHCLYRAVARQLQLQSDSSCDYLVCRSTAAAYIRSHAADFQPFIEGSSLSEYAHKVETSNEWGGHLEISALSHANKRTIAIFRAAAPLLLIGEEYAHNGPRLELSYHKHYYGLGEHYNSVRRC